VQSTLTGANFYRTDWRPTVCVWLGKEALYIFSLIESRLKTKSGGFDSQKLQSRPWWYRGFGYFESSDYCQDPSRLMRLSAKIWQDSCTYIQVLRYIDIYWNLIYTVSRHSQHVKTDSILDSEKSFESRV